MTQASLPSRAEVLLLLLNWKLLLTLFVGALVFRAVLSGLSSLAFLLMGKRERAGCLTFIVFLVSCDCKCSVALPHVAVGWSAKCDCSISWLYSLAFYCKFYFFREIFFTRRAFKYIFEILAPDLSELFSHFVSVLFSRIFAEDSRN